MITLRKWSDGDRAVLDRTVGDAAMMLHLGGPEDAAAMDARHLRYVASASCDRGAMYVIIASPEQRIVGTTGFWAKTWRDAEIFECGWMVFREHAGRGYACAAAREIIALARSSGGPSMLHAFPAIANIASNEVCRKAGFTNEGPCAFEYPKGRTMSANDWRLDLRAPPIA